MYICCMDHSSKVIFFQSKLAFCPLFSLKQSLCVGRALVEHNPGAVSLSTDDYFTRNGDYHFDPGVLGEAHMWNQKRGTLSVFY